MDSSRHEGRVAVVTGAGSGIGRASAQRLSQEGASVVVVDADAARAEETARSLPGPAVAVTADVSAEEGVRAYMDAALDSYGRVDLYHLNAGISGRPTSLVDLEVDEWDRVMAVNMRGVFLGLRDGLRQYFRQGTTGAVVVTASIASLRGSADLFAYHASKHGVTGIIRAGAAYAAPAGIRVNGVAPGLVPTTLFGEAGRADMVRRSSTTPMRRAGDPEEIASVVAFLLSDDSSYMTGQLVSIDGGSSIITTVRDSGGAGAWDTGLIDDALAADRERWAGTEGERAS